MEESKIILSNYKERMKKRPGIGAFRLERNRSVLTIGKTTYLVTSRFKTESDSNLVDKLGRLINRDISGK